MVRSHLCLCSIYLTASNSFHLSHSDGKDAREPVKDASGFRVVSKPLVLQKKYRLGSDSVSVFMLAYYSDKVCVCVCWLNTDRTLCTVLQWPTRGYSLCGC